MGFAEAKATVDDEEVEGGDGVTFLEDEFLLILTGFLILVRSEFVLVSTLLVETGEEFAFC